MSIILTSFADWFIMSTRVLPIRFGGCLLCAVFQQDHPQSAEHKLLRSVSKTCFATLRAVFRTENVLKTYFIVREGAVAKCAFCTKPVIASQRRSVGVAIRSP